MIAGNTWSEKSASRSGNSSWMAIQVDRWTNSVVRVRPREEEEKRARPTAQATATKAPGAFRALPPWIENRKLSRRLQIGQRDRPPPRGRAGTR